MKLVALIGGTSAPLIYFANKIHAHHKIELLVIQNKKASTSISKEPVHPASDQSFYEKVINHLKFRVDLKKQINKKRAIQKSTEKYYEQIFNGLHENISPEIPTLFVDDINSLEVEEKLSQIKPDLIVNHGTSLVKDKIIDLGKLSLNLHWGLSPYYRGIMCTNQALLNWDVNNIGVTIHKLAKEIDGGDILGQKRIKIMPDDNVSRITGRLTLQGTEIMIQAIDLINNGSTLKFFRQDFTQGFLIRGINWNSHINSFINSIDEKLMEKMIARPSRKERPIIEIELQFG